MSTTGGGGQGGYWPFQKEPFLIPISDQTFQYKSDQTFQYKSDQTFQYKSDQTFQCKYDQTFQYKSDQTFNGRPKLAARLPTLFA